MHKHITNPYNRIAKNIDKENAKLGNTFMLKEKLEIGGMPEWNFSDEFKKRENEAKKAIR